MEALFTLVLVVMFNITFISLETTGLNQLTQHCLQGEKSR